MSMHDADEPREFEALIARAQCGDAEAREALLRQHLAGLQAFVRVRLGERLRARETSMDLVQSVCGDVLGDLQAFEYRGPESFRRWLFRCAENKLRNRARFWSQERRELARETGVDATEAISAELRILSTPSRDAMAREELERLEAALLKLPGDYSEVILLSRVVGLSHDEVAAELGRTPSATRTLLSRALAKLSIELTDE